MKSAAEAPTPVLPSVPHLNAEQAMRRALDRAESALCLSAPNPRVGCVITDAQGRLLGEGHTQRAGGPHAEIMALQDAKQRGHDVRGARLYVTLEPCSHHGRTGPCCEAIVAAGIGEVHAACIDPHPKVQGQGLARLRAAGVVVNVGLCADEARALNIGFFSRCLRGKPWVRMKGAMSLDGRTALPNGQSQWITGEAARQDGHFWRARACVVLTGMGTVLADDPRLDVRDLPERHRPLQRQPHLLVLDSRLELASLSSLLPDKKPARLWQPTEPPRQIWVASVERNPEKEAVLADLGAQHLVLPPSPTQPAHVDLQALLRELAGREVNELHIEAGARLNASWLQSGEVDELLLYVAPKLLGAGPGLAAELADLGALSALPAVSDLAALPPEQLWRFHQIDRVGADLRLLLRRPEGETFLND